MLKKKQWELVASKPQKNKKKEKFHIMRTKEIKIINNSRPSIKKKGRKNKEINNSTTTIIVLRLQICSKVKE